MLKAETQIFIYQTILTCIVLAFSTLLVVKRGEIRRYSSLISLILLSFCIVFIGFREVSEMFGDTVTYSVIYSSFSPNTQFDTETSGDYGFFVLQYICSFLQLSVNQFFVVCAMLYVIPLFIVAKKISIEYSSIILLTIISSMSFFSYGVNGIRNGIATSFLLLAFVHYKKIFSYLILSIIAISFHKSVLLPFIAFFIARYYHNYRFYLLLWCLSIPFHFIIKDYISTLIMAIDFVSNRADGYLNDMGTTGYNVKFRIDFLLYSFCPILIGGYFILRKNFNDIFYKIIYSAYLVANAIWILIIDVPYSNRFAYLSWFMMPVLLIYPFLFCEHINKRFSKSAFLMLCNLLFTLII